MFTFYNRTPIEVVNILRILPRKYRNIFKTNRQLKKISQDDSLLSPIFAGKYDQNLSYFYKWRTFKNKHLVRQYCFVTDKTYGGSSTGAINFNSDEECVQIKDILPFHPSIGMRANGLFKCKAYQFDVLGIELKSDGKPIHVEIGFRTVRYGRTFAYGIILSQKKDFHLYEIPFINMILLGQEQNHKTKILKINTDTSNYTLANREMHNMRTLYQSDFHSDRYLKLFSVAIRLISDKAINREVSVRSINLLHRAGYQKLIQQYRQPYFFVSPQQQAIQHPTYPSLFMLSKSYDSLDVIDCGDKKYYRKK